jgi:hypothetical protein
MVIGELDVDSCGMRLWNASSNSTVAVTTGVT